MTKDPFAVSPRARRQLAVDYGRLRGWKLSTRIFSLARLTSNPGRGVELVDGWWDDDMGLEYYYRESRRPFRPAAIAVHITDNDRWTGQADDAAELLADFGITTEEIVPSWEPSMTLVVYRRKAIWEP